MMLICKVHFAYNLPTDSPKGQCISFYATTIATMIKVEVSHQ